MDLVEYAEEQGPGRITRCVVCTLPPEILEQVNASRGPNVRRDVTYVVITKWLVAEGHRIKYGSVANHFQHGHSRS